MTPWQHSGGLAGREREPVNGSPPALPAHYFFPPARAYPLNRSLFRLKSDEPFGARYLADAGSAMAELGVGAKARKR
jgi:hypothetical protein